MSLLGILFGIAMLFLVGKAIIETLWGLCLIVQGLICHLLAFILNILAEVVGILARLKKVARR